LPIQKSAKLNLSLAIGGDDQGAHVAQVANENSESQRARVRIVEIVEDQHGRGPAAQFLNSATTAVE